MVRQPVEETIRARVEALLRERPEVKQYEFGRAIGRGYSWVSAFLKGTRPVTDIALLMRIARYFPVSPSYLLGEPGKPTDAVSAQMEEVWRLLPDHARTTALAVAKSLLQAAATPESDDGSPGAGSGSTKRKPR